MEAVAIECLLKNSFWQNKINLIYSLNFIIIGKIEALFILE